MSSWFGGGNKQQAPNVIAPTVQDTGQANAQRQIGRAALYLTSPQGVTQQTQTTSGRLLGN